MPSWQNVNSDRIENEAETSAGVPNPTPWSVTRAGMLLCPLVLASSPGCQTAVSKITREHACRCRRALPCAWRAQPGQHFSWDLPSPGLRTAEGRLASLTPPWAGAQEGPAEGVQRTQPQSHSTYHLSLPVISSQAQRGRFDLK